MKELKNKKGYADADLTINLSVDYEDDNGELVELEDVEALDFLETIGYDEPVMEKIWKAIADDNYWGLFDVEYEEDKWASIKWDICDSVFTVCYNLGDDYYEFTFKEFYNEFFSIFEDYITYVSNSSNYRLRLYHYWETEIDLDDYPYLIRAIETR